MHEKTSKVISQFQTLQKDQFDSHRKKQNKKHYKMPINLIFINTSVDNVVI